MTDIAERGRVLIVDDELEMTLALSAGLADAGFEVTGVSDSATALDELRRGKFDVLLSDLQMPKLDGVKLLRMALEIDENLIGIIMTGEATIESANEAVKLGAFEYVVKPFKLKTILDTLDRGISRRRQATVLDGSEYSLREDA
jgi:DNA-binding NtrC family response regulator